MEKTSYLSGAREQILLKFYNEFLVPLFASKGYTLPSNVRVSIGMPKNMNVAGSTYHPRVGSNYYHIFLSPFKLYEYEEFFGTLIHEAIHTLYFDHKKGFQDCGAAVGLVPPWVASSPGNELIKQIQTWVFNENIEWKEPSIELVPEGLTLPFGGGGRGSFPRPIGAPKPQAGRMVKLSCPDCNYIIRTAKANILNKGLPVCPCGATFQE